MLEKPSKKKKEKKIQIIQYSQQASDHNPQSISVLSPPGLPLVGVLLIQLLQLSPRLLLPRQTWKGEEVLKVPSLSHSCRWEVC